MIQEANRFFLDQVQKQVNTSLTLRNWIVGYYIVEYEQNGQYGEQLFQKLAERLKRPGIKGLSFTTLHLCKQFYETYPQILQSLPEQSEYIENTSTHLLLSRLSFTHFVDLIKADT